MLLSLTSLQQSLHPSSPDNKKQYYLLKTCKIYQNHNYFNHNTGKIPLLLRLKEDSTCDFASSSLVLQEISSLSEIE